MMNNEFVFKMSIIQLSKIYFKASTVVFSASGAIPQAL